MSADVASSDRRAWRVLFVVAATALTVGTHWPRLAIDLDGAPAPDKLLHAGAFGLVTLLLWMTGWVKRFRTLAVIGVAWAMIDEITQGAPGLSRTVSIHDAVASSIGVVLAVALVWSVSEVPARRAGLIAERRLRWSAQRAAAGWRGLAAIVGCGCIGGVIGVLVALLLAFVGRISSAAEITVEFMRPVVGGIARLFGEAQPVELALIGLGLGALVGAHFALELRRRRVLIRLTGSCLRCGTAKRDSRATTDASSMIESAAFDTTADPRQSDGWWNCPKCREPQHPVADDLPPLPARVILELALIGAGLFVAALVVAIALLGVAVAAWASSDAIRRLSGDWVELPVGMPFVLDMLWIGLLLAGILRFLRRRLARRIDAQGEHCLGCRYDLRATPARDFRGSCPECGTAFVRVRAAAESS